MLSNRGRFKVNEGDIEADTRGNFVKKYSSNHDYNDTRYTKKKYPPIFAIMWASFSVSLLTHKVAHICFDNDNGGLEMNTMIKCFWISSIFFSDTNFLAVTYSICYYILIHKKLLYKTTKVFGGFLCCVTFLICSLEIQSLLSLGEAFPWYMIYDMFQEWDQFKSFAMEAAKQEESVPIWIIWSMHIILTAGCLNLLVTRKWQPREWLMKLGKMKLYFFSFLLIYSSLVSWFRPDIPYDHYSHMPLSSVGTDILYSFLEPSSNTPPPHISSFSKTLDSSPFEQSADLSIKPKINIVLLILESTRADLMPFDNSTRWAKIMNLSRIPPNKATPFFHKLVHDEHSFHIPHIKGSSGITIKSLFGMLCSMHSLPISMTQEHKSKFYHQCLPHVLKRAGYNAQLFAQSSIIQFDHQDEVITKIGFNDTYTLESYSKEYDLTEPKTKATMDMSNKTKHETREDWIRGHSSNSMSYEDDLFLDPLLKWVDVANTANITHNIEPFFLSYLTGITHWPFQVPPAADWDNIWFAYKKSTNDMMNAIAYQDRFLSKLFLDFEKRGLMNSTLFILTGDHGANFRNRAGQFMTTNQYHEEMFDVGVTFHTKNKGLAKKLSDISGLVINNNTWASIDIMPTILDMIGLQGLYTADGVSMLNPQRNAQRMTFSTSNPGSRMILRDRNFIIVAPNKIHKRRGTHSKVFDLSKDPFQEDPSFLDDKQVDNSKKYLMQWGLKARRFIEMIEDDLLEAHRTGKRCSGNCSLAHLDSLETLEEWDGF